MSTDIEKLSQFLQTSIEQAVTQQIASLEQSTGQVYRVFRSQNNPAVTIALRDVEQLAGYDAAFGPETFNACMQWTHENPGNSEANSGATNARK